MISIPSFAPSASKPHDKDVKREQNPRYTRYIKREQNPRYTRYNGLNHWLMSLLSPIGFAKSRLSGFKSARNRQRSGSPETHLGSP